MHGRENRLGIFRRKARSSRAGFGSRESAADSPKPNNGAFGEALRIRAALLHERDTDRTCGGRKEIEAESVAYLVAHTLGIDSAAYTFPYVARWADSDPKVIRDTATRVITCARTITGHLEPQDTPAPPEA